MPDDMVGLSFVGWVEGGQLSKPLVRQVFDYGDDLLGFVRDILLREGVVAVENAYPCVEAELATLLVVGLLPEDQRGNGQQQ